MEKPTFVFNRDSKVHVFGMAGEVHRSSNAQTKVWCKNFRRSSLQWRLRLTMIWIVEESTCLQVPLAMQSIGSWPILLAVQLFLWKETSRSTFVRLKLNSWWSINSLHCNYFFIYQLIVHIKMLTWSKNTIYIPMFFSFRLYLPPEVWNWGSPSNILIVIIIFITLSSASHSRTR